MRHKKKKKKKSTTKKKGEREFSHEVGFNNGKKVIVYNPANPFCAKSIEHKLCNECDFYRFIANKQV